MFAQRNYICVSRWKPGRRGCGTSSCLLSLVSLSWTMPILQRKLDAASLPPKSLTVRLLVKHPIRSWFISEGKALHVLRSPLSAFTTISSFLRWFKTLLLQHFSPNFLKECVYYGVSSQTQEIWRCCTCLAVRSRRKNGWSHCSEEKSVPASVWQV